MSLGRLSALGLAMLVAACGGAAPAADTNAVAQRAMDPRTNDPTAAQPPTPPKELARPLPTATPAQPTGTGTGGGGTTTTTSGTAEAPPTRISARHVLVMYMGSQKAPPNIVRTREQAIAMAEEVLRRAKAGEDFARLAVEYSDEPGAAGRGGSLGRFTHGQMVPAFEEAAFKLKVGEISGVVETPFGFHVIQRTE